jgi:methylated-DNA-[protein]-cysteine S-methyltransferase
MSDNVIQLLATPSTGEAQRLAALHDTLVERATTAELVDVTYRTVDSPVGPLLLAATDIGTVRVAYAVENHDRVLDTLSRHIGSRVLKSGKRFDQLVRELDEYFDGRRHTFEVAVDLRLAHGFRLSVLQHLRDIPYGSTESYSQVAAAAGSPRAVRAVGSACATNPVPIVVPCHRVVRSDGSLGGYLGGIAVKEQLLGLESAA